MSKLRGASYDRSLRHFLQSFISKSPRNSSSLLHPASRRCQVILKVERQHTSQLIGGNGGRTLQIAVLVCELDLLHGFFLLLVPSLILLYILWALNVSNSAISVISTSAYRIKSPGLGHPLPTELRDLRLSLHTALLTDFSQFSHIRVDHSLWIYVLRSPRKAHWKADSCKGVGISVRCTDLIKRQTDVAEFAVRGTGQ